MKVDISMLYEKDEDRPKEGSVQLDFTPQLSEEDLENVKEHFEAFYEESLCEAVEKAFM